MSVRNLPEDRADGSSGWSSDRETIERIAETKGLDEEIETIDVVEGETDSGDDIVKFRVYHTVERDANGDIDEVNSAGAEIIKMPDVPTADEAFRQDVQQTLSQLKRHLMGSEDDEDIPDVEDDRAEQTDVDVQTDVAGDGPGATIDGQIADHEARIVELEERIDELEEYVDALEGLQKLMGDD